MDNAYKEVKEIINTGEIYPYEYDGEYMANVYLAKINQYDVYVYGMCDDTDMIIRHLQSEKICVKAIIDSNSEIEGREYLGIKIVHPQNMKVRNSQKSFCFVLTSHWLTGEKNDIVTTLYNVGIKQFFSIWNNVEVQRHLSMSNNGWERGRRRYYYNSIERFKELFAILGDQESKDIIVEYIRCVFLNKVFDFQYTGAFVDKYFRGGKNIVWK